MIIRHFWKSFFYTLAIGALALILLSVAIRNLGHYLEVPSEPQVSDVIIVPSGGGIERVEKAVELYREGYGKRLILSGKADDETSPSNAESMYEYALKSGIPADALIQEPYARNTWENITFSDTIIADDETKLLFVTSAYHMKRLKLIAEKVFPDKELSYQSVSIGFWDPDRWWIHPKGAWLTVSESMKIFLGKIFGIWYAL